MGFPCRSLSSPYTWAFLFHRARRTVPPSALQIPMLRRGLSGDASNEQVVLRNRRSGFVILSPKPMVSWTDQKMLQPC